MQFRRRILSLLSVTLEREEQDTQLACLGLIEVSSPRTSLSEGFGEDGCGREIGIKISQ
jgi:hypothetical protein